MHGGFLVGTINKPRSSTWHHALQFFSGTYVTYVQNLTLIFLWQLDLRFLIVRPVLFDVHAYQIDHRSEQFSDRVADAEHGKGTFLLAWLSLA